MKNNPISFVVSVAALLCLGVMVAPVNAQTAAKVAAPIASAPAETVVGTAVKQAAVQKKTALVIFHASWCGWCHKLDDALNGATLKPVVDRYFVVTHLTVMESGDKKADENAGGETWMKKWGGEKSGLPFYVFLDAKGKKIADSNVMPKNQNIGYPGSPEEIEAFMTLLKRAAPKLSAPDAETMNAYLKENAPKPSGG